LQLNGWEKKEKVWKTVVIQGAYHHEKDIPQAEKVAKLKPKEKPEEIYRKGGLKLG